MATTMGTSGFEGPEKNLEIDFVPNVGQSLRSLTRSAWDRILNEANCKIMSSCHNEHLDAYVLSESSLFVYDYKVLLKTCGTTTLLKCIPIVLEESNTLGMVLEWIGYSRKNFTFPEDQHFPHTSFDDETKYANDLLQSSGERLIGGSYVLGDLNADHWFVYIADYCTRGLEDSLDRNVNIMMYDLDPEVLKLFFAPKASDGENFEDYDTVKREADKMTKAAGIDTLVPGAKIDDWMFEPCGYSMNAILFDSFYTIHVTPEDAFSYASFETNLHAKSYDALIRNVLNVFKPKRFTITFFADDAAMETIHSSPTCVSYIPMNLSLSSKNGPRNDECCRYQRTTRSSTCVATDYHCEMANFASMEESHGLIKRQSRDSFLTPRNVWNRRNEYTNRSTPVSSISSRSPTLDDINSDDDFHDLKSCCPQSNSAFRRNDFSEQNFDSSTEEDDEDQGTVVHEEDEDGDKDEECDQLSINHLYHHHCGNEMNPEMSQVDTELVMSCYSVPKSGNLPIEIIPDKKKESLCDLDLHTDKWNLSQSPVPLSSSFISV